MAPLAPMLLAVGEGCVQLTLLQHDLEALGRAAKRDACRRPKAAGLPGNGRRLAALEPFNVFRLRPNSCWRIPRAHNAAVIW